MNPPYTDNAVLDKMYHPGAFNEIVPFLLSISEYEHSSFNKLAMTGLKNYP